MIFLIAPAYNCYLSLIPCLSTVLATAIGIEIAVLQCKCDDLMRANDVFIECNHEADA